MKYYRNLLKLIFVFTAIFIFNISCSNKTEKKVEKPNIIFLFSDDQRADGLGYSGNKVINTPNLDKLAGEGTYFKNSFVTTSICCASRVAVLTGQYALRNGIDDFETGITDSAFNYTYPVILRNNGYYTGFIGKFGIRANHQAYVDSSSRFFDYWAADSWQANYWHERNCPYVTNDGVHDKTNNHCTCPANEVYSRINIDKMKDPIQTTVEIVPNKVKQFIETRNVDKPFCLSISFKAPHGAWDQYSKEFNEMYNESEMPFAVTATKKDADKLPEFLKKTLGSPQGAKYAANHKLLAEQMRDYYRTISSLDESIGKIREILKEQGVADNTVLIFSSDNGHFLGEHGLGGKWLAYEPSIRVPTIIYDPREKNNLKGKTENKMVLNIDIPATILDYAKADIPKNMQGKSLIPLLNNTSTDWRKDWLYEHRYTHNGVIVPCEGVRTENMKYINYFSQKPVVEELYDLEKDPNETNNLIHDKLYTSKLEDIRKRYQEFKISLR